MKYNSRINKIKQKLKRSKLDAAIFVGRDNRIYLCGFAGTAGILVVGLTKPVLIVDGRYLYRARSEVRGLSSGASAKEDVRCEGLHPQESYFEGLGRILKENKVKKVGIDENEMNLKFFQNIKRKVKAKFKTIGDFVEEIRASKDTEEIKKIKGAIRIAEKALRALFKDIKPGMTEKDVQTELIYYLHKFGSQGLPFEPIVASGIHGAHPHHSPSKKKLKKGKTIIIDCGARFDGYSSDITRTIVLGKMSKEHKHIFNVVYNAKEAARKLLKDGVKCIDIDRAVRKIFKKSDVEHHFLHATGHGVGISVHEGPRISLRSKDILKKGMVVTIEPGLYVKGWGGVRVEDMYLITKSGSKRLTNLPRLIEKGN